jgi:tRNA nucleotidyltransferase (CCA-adding enzyme)
MPPEGLALIWARAIDGPSRRLVADFWTRYRRIRTAITGRDLVRAGYRPGPKLGEALKRVTSAKLDGLVDGREEEMRLAQHYLEDGR